MDEPHKLRGNALARRFFIDSQTGRFSAASERLGAGRLLRLVIDGAEAARNSDLQAGHEERAHRHFAIATRCLIQRLHPVVVARELGISERQCYRDRALVCERLARYVSSASVETPRHAVEISDRLDLRFERTAQLADLGCEEEAARRYADIVRAQEPAKTKLRALGMLSEVLLACGRIDRAQAAVDAARAVLRAGRREMLANDVEVGECRIALAGAKVAWDSVDFPRATGYAREAAARSDMLLAATAPDAALCAEAFITQAVFCLNYGQAGEAREMLLKARGLTPRHGSARLDLETALLSTELDTGSIAGFREVGPALRLAELRRVLDAAVASRLFKIAVKAHLALADEYAGQRDSAAVAENVRKALAMAREIGGARFVATITINALDVLSVTDEEHLFSELVRTEVECRTGSLEWILQKMFRIHADMRIRRYDSAWASALDAERAARRSENRRLQAAIKRQLAEIAHKSRRTREARDYIEEALDGATRHGTASSRLLTLSVAAKITGDAAFKRDASELKSAMAV